MNRLKRSYTRAKKANEGPREHGPKLAMSYGIKIEKLN